MLVPLTGGRMRHYIGIVGTSTICSVMVAIVRIAAAEYIDPS